MYCEVLVDQFCHTLHFCFAYVIREKLKVFSLISGSINKTIKHQLKEITRNYADHTIFTS